VRWLAERIQDSSEGADEQIVRLESDADLVKVVTVHKSKGLEYPVVLLPFATAVRSARSRGLAAVSVMGPHGRRELHLEPSDEVLAMAERERLQEDLRLLYVALTRARHALWVGVAALQQDKACVAHRSAFGYLAAGGSPVTEDGLLAAVDALASGQGEVVAEAVNPTPPRTLLRRHDREVPLIEPVPYAAQFERRWSVGSFSSIVRHIASAPMPALAGVVREDEVLASSGADQSVSAAITQPWHSFPRGALPGNFLHDQLEWLAEEQFGLARSEALQERLRKRCDRQGWAHRADEVVAWLGDVVSSPLPPVGASLDALACRLPEMEFWFPIEALPTGEVDRLCREHLLGGIARPALPERELRGMLTGFADLVFVHGGRYWVLDYKSNALGNRDADYTSDALDASMAEHRYDVQAALYLLALHRLLRVRLGAGYDPRLHLGGAVYLFLRGIHGPAAGCCHVPASPAFLDALDEAFGACAEDRP